MWARHFEVCLAIWLALSWIILRYPIEMEAKIIHDLVTASLILLFSFLNYRYRYSHLLNLGVAIWLIILAFYSTEPTAFAQSQNYMVLGILLLIFGIIPPRASLLTPEWTAFLDKKNKLE
jgi:hypothetical protein